MKPILEASEGSSEGGYQSFKRRLTGIFQEARVDIEDLVSGQAIRACEGRVSCMPANLKNLEIEINPGNSLDSNWRNIENQIRVKLKDDPEAHEKIKMIKR